MDGSDLQVRSPTKKVRLLQRMGLDDNRITNKDVEDTPTRTGGGKGATGQGEQSHATNGYNPTLRGMSTGGADPGAVFLSEGGIPMGFPYYPAYHGFHPGMHPCLASLWNGLGIPNDWACTAE